MHRSLLAAFRLTHASPLARSSSSNSRFSSVVQPSTMRNGFGTSKCSCSQTRSCSSHAAAQAMSEPMTEDVAISEDCSSMSQEILHFAPRKYIEFTCTICQNRVAKTFSKQAYEKGTVLIRCSGCQNLHLIADHINFTGYAEKTIEEIAAKKGEPVTTKWDGELMQSAFNQK